MNLDELVALANTRDEWPVVAEFHCPRCKGGNHRRRAQPERGALRDARRVARTILVEGQPLYVSLQLDAARHKAWVDLRRVAKLMGGQAPKVLPHVRRFYAIPDGTPQPAFCDRHGACTVNP